MTLEVVGSSSHSLDTRYEEEVSGCTASVGIVSKDKIWVVRDDIYTCVRE